MTNVAFTVLSWVLPVGLGPLVYVVARQLLNVHWTIDALPPWAKQFVVVALGTLLSAVLSALSVALPVECANLASGVTDACVGAINAPSVLRGITAGLVAIIMHALKKARAND